MSTILILTHEFDRFHSRNFMVAGLFPHWTEAGHRVVLHEGFAHLPPADIVWLHVDLTVIPEAYLEALQRYPVVINGATKNIAKRVFSEQLVTRDGEYDGPVIVKTNLNCGGFAEAFHAQMAWQVGQRAMPPPRCMGGRYEVLASPSLVPREVWTDPDLIVERFLPEQDERGYYVRTWMFLGDRERCNRTLGALPVVKADDTLERVPVGIPDELRVWRKRLGFDYGKFDFVIHQGKPVLFDVNRTPTVPGKLGPAIQAGMKDLAKGIEVFLT